MKLRCDTLKCQPDTCKVSRVRIGSHFEFCDCSFRFNEVISTAPPELRGGFFVSHLGFFDVQQSLSSETMSAVAIAASVAVVVLLVATQNPILSLISVTSILAIIFATVGTLVCLGKSSNCCCHS